jgi:hypothetical protein
MIAIRYEGSRVHKPWVVAEGEVRKLWPNAPPTWETDQILGTFQLQREAADFLLMYHIKGVLPKVKKKVGMRVAKPLMEEMMEIE